jgi:hypothetical protein
MPTTINADQLAGLLILGAFVVAILLAAAES